MTLHQVREVRSDLEWIKQSLATFVTVRIEEQNMILSQQVPLNSLYKYSNKLSLQLNSHILLRNLRSVLRNAIVKIK